jgi:hypothetical protein
MLVFHPNISTCYLSLFVQSNISLTNILTRKIHQISCLCIVSFEYLSKFRCGKIISLNLIYFQHLLETHLIHLKITCKYNQNKNTNTELQNESLLEHSSFNLFCFSLSQALVSLSSCLQILFSIIAICSKLLTAELEIQQITLQLLNTLIKDF